MNDLEYRIHLKAGLAYGEEATCGNKIDYKSEETAAKSAAALSSKYVKEMEAYPCYWCSGWHIGRAMTSEEIEKFSSL